MSTRYISYADVLVFHETPKGRRVLVESFSERTSQDTRKFERLYDKAVEWVHDNAKKFTGKLVILTAGTTFNIKYA